MSSKLTELEDLDFPIQVKMPTDTESIYLDKLKATDLFLGS